MKNTKPKMSMLIRTLKGGGAEKVFVNLANHFAKRGYDISLITTKNGKYFNLLSKHVNLVLLPDYQGCISSGRAAAFVNFISFYIRAYRSVLVIKPEILFCTLDISNIVGYLIKKTSFLKFKLVVRQANVITDGNLSPGLKKLLIPTFKNAELVIANSPDTERSIENLIKGKAKNLKTIGNPVYSNYILDLGKNPIEYIFSKDKKYLLNVGSLTDQKDQKTLIRALSIVKKSVSNVHLIILGQGPLEKELKELTEKLELCDHVSFLGFIENPYPFYAAADLFVLSSIYEGFGNVIIEALAFGTPVISTTCSGGPNLILKDGEFGDLVLVQNHIALAEAIIYRLANLGFFKKEDLVRRAQQFSIDEIGDKYLNVVLS